MRGPVGGNELVARGSWGSLNFDTQHKQLLSRIFSHTTKICTHTHATKASHCRQESKPTPLISISVWYYTWHWRPPRRQRGAILCEAGHQQVTAPALFSPLCAVVFSFSVERWICSAGRRHVIHTFLYPANLHCLFVCTSWLSLKSYQPTKKTKKRNSLFTAGSTRFIRKSTLTSEHLEHEWLIIRTSLWNFSIKRAAGAYGSRLTMAL